VNEIYGIDPNIKIDIKDLHILLKTFGLSEGRFIGAYPDNLWWGYLLENIIKNDGFDESRLEILKKKYRDVILPILHHYKIEKNTPKDWCEKASQIKAKEKAFTEIFSVKSNFYSGPTIDDLIIGEKYDPSLSRGDHIPSTLESYIHAIKPLLIKSSEVHFVDKFFVPWSDTQAKERNRRLLLELIFKEAKKSNRCESIFFHLSEKHFMTDKEFDPSLEQKLVDSITEIKLLAGFDELNFQCRIYEKMKHGRYMFSIKGGLQFDSGFDINPKETNHVHWLGKTELDPLFDEYVET
jgi:hypothetical protein